MSIGEGAFSAVYKGIDTKSKETVAIKFVNEKKILDAFNTI
jgi:serine/threonine protein kinase